MEWNWSQSVVYCSQQCLTADWSNHKIGCSSARELQGSRNLTDLQRKKHEEHSQQLLQKIDPFLFLAVNLSLKKMNNVEF